MRYNEKKKLILEKDIVVRFVYTDDQLLQKLVECTVANTEI